MLLNVKLIGLLQKGGRVFLPTARVCLTKLWYLAQELNQMEDVQRKGG